MAPKKAKNKQKQKNSTTTQNAISPSQVVIPSIPDTISDDLTDDSLFRLYSAPINFDTTKTSESLKITFHFSFQGPGKNTLPEKIVYEFEIKNKGNYTGLNDVLSAATELLIADGLDHLYSGRFFDAMHLFSVARKIQDTNSSFRNFPSMGCVWLSLGMVYMLRSPENSSKCFYKARESFGQSKNIIPSIAMGMDRIVNLLNNENKVQIDKVLNELSKMTLELHGISYRMNEQDKVLLSELGKSMSKTLPDAKSRLKKAIIDENPNYEVWETRLGSRQVSLEYVKMIKNDETIKLLLDEAGRIYVNGREKTLYFKNRRISYTLLKYFLENKGSAFLEDVLTAYRKTKKGNVAKKTLIRSIRHLNDILKKLGVKNGIFFANKERMYFPTEVRLCCIKHKSLSPITPA